MPEPANPNVTRILSDISAGNAASADDLLPLVYAQLRAIAQQRMAGERKDHTLQATALVHEAYVKLVGGDAEGAKMQWSGRAAFFKTAAEAMRRILIDHARSRDRVKRGGQPGESAAAPVRLPLSVVDLAVDLATDSDSERILALDQAIDRLKQVDPRGSEVVRLRFFAGLSIDETAAALDIAPRTVKRDWEFARVWLFNALSDDAVDARDTRSSHHDLSQSRAVQGHLQPGD